MSRSETIRSLVSNIKAYRGMHYGTAQTPKDKIKWVRTPQPDKKDRIRELLVMLVGDRADELIGHIDGFRDLNDFHRWLELLESKKL